MSKYRNALPQLADNFFLTDGGIETTLIFHNGLDLPYFAAFDLLKDAEGEMTLREYFETYVSLARKHEVGFILESATWRANPDWGQKLGYSNAALAEMNHKAIKLLGDIRQANESDKTPMVISGCIGPRGDGYDPGDTMSAAEAEQYHATQIGTFRDTEADMVTAITMTYVDEAIGISRAAKSAGLPVAISFTVETDGNLPTGQSLQSAIEQVDAATDNEPAYYMINCAHPTHFGGVVATQQPWLQRVRGLRANASTMSHAELDEAEELDAGNPIQLGSQYKDLRSKLSHLTVFGGCCGTDHRHIEAIAQACAS